MVDVFLHHWVEGLKEVVFDESDNAGFLVRLVRPEGREAFRGFPGISRCPRGVCFLHAEDVCIAAEFHHVGSAHLLSNRVMRQEALCVPRSDSVWSLVGGACVPSGGAVGVCWGRSVVAQHLWVGCGFLCCLVAGIGLMSFRGAGVSESRFLWDAVVSRRVLFFLPVRRGVFRGGGIPLPFRVCVADLVFFPFLGVFVAVVGLFSSRRCAGWFVTGACSFLGGGGVSVVVFFEVHKAPQCSPIGELAAYW